MGRKKPSTRGGDDDMAPPASQGGSKSKKKALIIDDDEYSIGTELSEEPKMEEEKASITGKNGGKKGNQKGRQQKEDDDADETGVEEEDVIDIAFTGKKKSKSKKTGGASLYGVLDEGLDDNNDDDVKSGLTGENEIEGEDEPGVSIAGKKKPSTKKLPKKSGGPSLHSVLDMGGLDDNNGDDENSISTAKNEDEREDEPVVSFTGKKKSSKKGKKGDVLSSASAFDAIQDDEGEGVIDNSLDSKREINEDDDLLDITFSGKKKPSKTGKKGGSVFSSVSFDALDEGAGDENNKYGEEEDVAAITFSGKKKSSKKKTGSALSTLNNENGFSREATDVSELAQRVESSNMESSDIKEEKGQEVAESSKNKKKKKNKSGRTAEEEEDLDKILAELGEGPPMPAPAAAAAAAPPLEEVKVQVQPEPVASGDVTAEKQGEEETAESAAAKKKKKKKEKEKEKKAAAAAAKEAKEDKPDAASEAKRNDAKIKATEKKIPKHVREMQEALARRKEAEERKKREEEERLRKEEEERRRQEELERQAEEAKRRKKEKEKEKLLRKKQEGKLLTGKQKEEARRREAMRNQILASAGGLPLDKDAVPAKRPIYSTKKPKPSRNYANGAAAVKLEEDEEKEKQINEAEPVHAMESKEAEVVDEVDLMHAVDESETLDKTEENWIEEDEDEDDWDAKSWDDLNINMKGSFDDEEADFEQLKPMEKKKDMKSAAPTNHDLGNKPTVTAKPKLEKSDVDRKKRLPEAEDASKTKRKEAVAKSKPLESDDASTNEENLRSPICCIMGHVDTGKTKLLDSIRGTNVQEGEAGGITQQIGATYFPAENIRERTKELKADAKLKVPGLLVIDTPGHESFTNLRSRGSGLCDIAILVVDIMHGLEPQTIESLNLLKMRKTEFIVALNKVDRLYGWKTCRNAPILKAIKQQNKDVINEFNMRLTGVITQFKEQGLNTELYYKNKEWGETSNIVPTSAISGEGIPDLLLLLVQWTQKTMVEKLTFSNKVQCTVLEVKVVEGHGTTIDVVLVNGVLHEGDQIVVCGLQGPIVTQIRALLTPHPMKELRVKGTYLHHKEIKAAQGIKITAQGLEHALAGTGLYVVGPEDDLEEIKETAMEDMRSVMSRIDKSGEGVCVQASTLGSLEALLEFLKSPEVKIPVSGISIGPVHKKDVMKASVMLERKKEYATILAFDVKVTPEARELADELGVKIFCADIIYHLFDQFKAYIDNIKEEKKRESADDAVFPSVLKILPNCIFNKKDPIVLGVDVLEGIAKVGTPICIPQRDFIDIGRISSIENNHKPVEIAKKGQKVAIKIVGTNPEEQQKMYGRHFDIDDELVSHISRRSIDVLKANYRDDLSTEEWKLLVKLKQLFKIP